MIFDATTRACDASITLAALASAALDPARILRDCACAADAAWVADELRRRRTELLDLVDMIDAGIASLTPKLSEAA